MQFVANPESRREEIINEDGTLVYVYRKWIKSSLATEVFDTLVANVPWQQQEFVMYGKKVNEPRLTFVAGNKGLIHSYTNIKRPVVNWDLPKEKGGCADIPGINVLREINNVLPSVTNGDFFNASLFNFYRDGSDYISAHSDKETSPHQTTVVSVSFGASRDFYFKRKTQPYETVKTVISNGDLMVMAGSCQQQWTHAVPKRAHAGPRISVTYRLLETNP